MRRITFIAVFGLPLSLAAGTLAQSQSSVLQLVKYEGLKQAVLKNRGKVVIVDFWGEF